MLHVKFKNEESEPDEYGFTVVNEEVDPYESYFANDDFELEDYEGVGFTVPDTELEDEKEYICTDNKMGVDEIKDTLEMLTSLYENMDNPYPEPTFLNINGKNVDISKVDSIKEIKNIIIEMEENENV